MLKKYLYPGFALLLIIASCGEKEEIKPRPDNYIPKLEGGDSGDYNVVFFSFLDGRAVSSRMYLKYAADKMPADTSEYNEKMNTMTEPGFGPHTHFNGLKKGTYYLYAKSASAQADTVFVLSETTKKNLDIKIHLQ